jgi:hypothetical protein
MGTVDREPYVWVIVEYPDGKMVNDGPHSPDKDLSTTYAILNGLCPRARRFWRVTMTPDAYNTHWPRFEDVTGLAKGGGVRPLLGILR